MTAGDLTPDLLAAGSRRPEAAGLDIEWVEADAENLPFEDGSFDVVMSAIGVMFAPHHQAAADELVRVRRPGGTGGGVGDSRGRADQDPVGRTATGSDRARSRIREKPGTARSACRDRESTWARLRLASWACSRASISARSP